VRAETMGKRMMLENGGSLQVDRHGTDAVIQIHDMEEDVVTVARATPAEWDAFVAAGDRALGRKPVRDFPPGPLPRARPSTDAEIVAWMADLYREDTPIAEALGRAALAMVREAGPTVPRGAVVAVRERFDKWIREEGGTRNEYVEGMTVGIKDAILALDAMLSASTTKEPGHADD
jgi:hypothetical protein